MFYLSQCWKNRYNGAILSEKLNVFWKFVRCRVCRQPCIKPLGIIFCVCVNLFCCFMKFYNNIFICYTSEYILISVFEMDETNQASLERVRTQTLKGQLHEMNDGSNCSELGHEKMTVSLV